MTHSSNPISSFRHGLSTLSLEEQKLAFNCLPDAFQAALWKDRLQLGIETVRDKAQKKLFGLLADLITPESYSVDKRNSAAQREIDEMEKQIEQVFPDHTVFERFTQFLGDAPCPEETIKMGKKTKPTCTCSTSRSCLLRHNDCGALTECLPGGCTKTNWGCGIAWLQSCDGLCTGKFC